jgi:hypothetical protein
MFLACYHHKMARISAAILIFASATTIAAAARQRATHPAHEPEIWQAPQCESVRGLPSFYFTGDQGDGISGSDLPAATNARPVVTTTDFPNLMFGTFDGGLYLSRDAGCNWALRAIIGLNFTNMISAAGGRAYAWNYTESHLLRIHTGGEDLVELPETMLTLGSDPSNADHIIGIVRLGKVYESYDGGGSWTSDRKAPVFVIAAAFDPRDVEHIAVGSFRKVAVTHDGGFTWQTAETDPNVFCLAFSPSDANVLWMYGPIPFGYQAIYRSTDDTRSFLPVLIASPGLGFNPVTLAPHPTNANVVAFSSWKGLAVLDGMHGTVRVGAMLRIWDDVMWSPTGKALYVISVRSTMRDP